MYFRFIYSNQRGSFWAVFEPDAEHFGGGLGAYPARTGSPHDLHRADTGCLYSAIEQRLRV